MASRTRGIGKSVHSPEQAAFCELMIAARKKAGLTQHDVAKRLRKPQSFVAKYEGGERRLDVVEFLTIARAIGADPLRLLKPLLRQRSRNPSQLPDRSDCDPGRAKIAR
jgi:transcriptional regulator with XRE-family HTH domain